MRDRVLMIGSNLVRTLLLIIAGIIITRSYSKLSLGTYQQSVLIYSILCVFLALGTPKAIFFFIEQDHDSKNFLWHIFSLLLASLLIACLMLIFLWSHLCRLFSNPSLVPLVYLVIWNLIFRTINELFIPVAIISKKKYYIWRTDFLLAILSVT